MNLTASDGVRLEYELHRGGPSAPRLLLVHSLAMDRHVWDGVIADLGGAAEIAALDCRGHGASAHPAGPYALERFAADLAELLDALGWERGFVAGMSMGGSVTLQFATLHPERVAGLGLIDTTAWYGPDAAKNWDERAAKAETDGLASLLAFQETRWFSDAFRERRPDVVAEAKATFVRNDLAAYAATCRMLGRFDLRAEIARLTCPTEIVVGEQDYATPPEMARALAGAIPGANLEVIAGARHSTAVEVPDVVAAMLRRLLARGKVAV